MIHTAHLFPILDTKLLELLDSLTPEEWHRPTIAKLWTVKDIASHLLDGNLRTLSLSRDKHLLVVDKPVQSYQDLVSYLNRLNADWTVATKRLSPQVLMNLLAITGREYCAYIASLNLDEMAIFPVTWAGEETSKNWFHIAREYTEKWHHQQQIREAVNRPGIMTKELFLPFIATLLQGLPHTFRDVPAAHGTTVQVTIESEIGGVWYLIKEEMAWQVRASAPKRGFQAHLSMHPNVAWKVFTKGITPGKALEQVSLEGDHVLARKALELVAVMA